AQRAAIGRDPGGQRRIVLATAIAETSLTLDGVAVVVDAGLSRRAEYDKAAGVTRLVTHRASQAAAAQRAGRAARQGQGVAYRLWEEAAHAGRPEFDPPEMLTSDLAPLRLTLAQWGAAEPAALPWIDPPPGAALAAATRSLQALRALDAAGTITPHGRNMARLPMDPAAAHMLLYAAQHGEELAAARLALLLQERGLGGRSDDLAARMQHWDRDRSGRARASDELAARWAKLARGFNPGQADSANAHAPSLPLGVLLAEAYPHNIARRRDVSGENWITAGGRGLRLDPASPLARAGWLAVGGAQGEAKGARITSAIALDETDVLRWLAHRTTRRSTLRWVADEGRVEALVETCLGAITFARGSDAAPDPEAIRLFLVEKIAREGLDILPLSKASQALLRRARYAMIAALGDDALKADASVWLGPLLSRRLDQTDPAKLHEALRGRLDYAAQQALERHAPAQFASPAGTSHAIDYDDPGGPSVELRVQALFGLDQHPTFGQPPQPLLLKLTDPGGKPLQTTRDLPGFWRGSWKDVQRDMKGRYPKHRWPDQPWTEAPSLKTKNAFNRSG
ncbi:ATP-dependent helicase C-terminal domain-containing protein, partial [Novosphingobium sp.]|uniref:ATP-dependent helicase C-terminal domain-containing protein n=1 Tax=Novosphingobium sp. TaxID=1874826 RepID=UPI0025DDBC23